MSELGGAVHAGPFDVMDAGRMALVADPQGAVVALWRPGRHIGATVVNEPGAMSLNQLNTSDPEAATRFYGDLLGWDVVKQETGGPDYWGIYNDGALNGGMMELAGAHAPPHWQVYFGAEDAAAAVARVGELGGGTFLAPTDVPGGRLAVVHDPQGAAFAFFAGRFDP